MLTLIVDNGKLCFSEIPEKLKRHCPELEIIDVVASGEEARTAMTNVSFELLLMEFNHCCNYELLNESKSYDFQTIFLSDSRERAYDAIKYHPSGFVLMPVCEQELKNAVNNAYMRKKSRMKQERSVAKNVSINKSTPTSDLIGIPTFNGFEFSKPGDIIRCEGLQKCTKIILKDKPNIVSSYNIGEFEKLLGRFGFFSTHKSHLVNLSCIRRYSRQGTLEMGDSSIVPVSRRRKKDFLLQFFHI